MAAHIWTYLLEAMALGEQGKFDEKQLEMFQYALGYAPLGNLIDFDDYVLLTGLKTPEVFLLKVEELSPKYHQLWLNAGQPRNYEEWHDRLLGMTPCPVCSVVSVYAEPVPGWRVWAGCGHLKEELNDQTT